MNRIFTLSLALITAGFCAAQEVPNLITLRAQLATNIATCDAAQFETNWKNYQEVAPVADAAIIRAHLLALATQLKNHKEQVKTEKLAHKKSRILAGLCATPMAGAGIAFFALYSYLFLTDFTRTISDFTKNLENAAVATGFALIGLLASRYALQNIAYARFAGTQQLTTDIAALDTILALLNQEQMAQITQN